MHRLMELVIGCFIVCDENSEFACRDGVRSVLELVIGSINAIASAGIFFSVQWDSWIMTAGLVPLENGVEEITNDEEAVKSDCGGNLPLKRFLQVCSGFWLVP